MVAEDNRSREGICQRLIHHKIPEGSDIGPTNRCLASSRARATSATRQQMKATPTSSLCFVYISAILNFEADHHTLKRKHLQPVSLLKSRRCLTSSSDTMQCGSRHLNIQFHLGSQLPWSFGLRSTPFAAIGDYPDVRALYS